MNARGTLGELLDLGCGRLDRAQEERELVEHELAESVVDWNREREVLQAEVRRAGEATAHLSQQLAEAKAAAARWHSWAMELASIVREHHEAADDSLCAECRLLAALDAEDRAARHEEG